MNYRGGSPAGVLKRSSQLPDAAHSIIGLKYVSFLHGDSGGTNLKKDEGKASCCAFEEMFLWIFCLAD